MFSPRLFSLEALATHPHIGLEVCPSKAGSTIGFGGLGGESGEGEEYYCHPNRSQVDTQPPTNTNSMSSMKEHAVLLLEAWGVVQSVLGVVLPPNSEG